MLFRIHNEHLSTIPEFMLIRRLSTAPRQHQDGAAFEKERGMTRGSGHSAPLLDLQGHKRS